MNAAAELKELLGAATVSSDSDDLLDHAHDWSPAALLSLREGRAPARPSCVVRPRSVEQVAQLLAWADRARVPVVPFGGGSGVCRAIEPDGQVVMDTRGLDAIVDIDYNSRLATVQAGVGGADLQRELAGQGLTLGHEPQSVAISTVGGWIATRACGQLSARYGGIEDLVVGLEAVLPRGRVVRSKVTPRRSTGPDVAALLIGSEGAFGVITEATLRVSPIAGERIDRCLTFSSMSDGVAACRSLAQSDLAPTLVRLYDEQDTMIFLRHFEDAPQGPLLLLAFEGADAAARADGAVAVAGGTVADERFASYWWEHRNDAVHEFRRLMAGEGLLGPHAVIDTMEVAGTWTILRGLYDSITDALGGEADVVGCHLSHVYPDGACLYFTIGSACASDVEARATLERWWATGMEACLRAGGTISHHHGIGRLKAPWLRSELGELWDVLVAVKRAVDPNRIMNPGALGL